MGGLGGGAVAFPRAPRHHPAMNPPNPATRAVVLAAGKGSRMQAGSHDLPLTPLQRRAASEGAKALIPLNGEPFLSYVLSGLADGGIEDVCLVVGPGDHPVRRHFENVIPTRISISFAVQPTPRGTGDAVLAAASWVADEPFLVVNGDNVYPAQVVREVRHLPGLGLAGFESRALGVPPERLSAYAVLSVSPEGELLGIQEKPTPEAIAALAPNPLMSMTCWRLTPSIFPYIRALAPSVRGELELPSAVLAMAQAEGGVRVAPVAASVPDLTSPSDILKVERELQTQRVWL
jgi:dTDP-glucose pyrophosphorylase